MNASIDNLTCRECNHTYLTSASYVAEEMSALKRDAEPSQPTNRVPAAELNPLANPLLGRNMGRWAEVYFTAPPERREEAVQELLQQLQREDSGEQDFESKPSGSIASPPLQQSFRQDEIDRGDQKAPVAVGQAEAFDICSRCGHENEANQRFCGMCGTPLHASSNESVVREENVQPRAAAPPRVHEEPPRSSSGGFGSYSIYGSQQANYSEDASEEDHLFEFPESPNSYSYRVFIGLALALLIGTLAYMAWRGGQAASSLSQQAPQPPAQTQRSSLKAQDPDPTPDAPSTKSNSASSNSAGASAPSQSAVPSETVESAKTAPPPAPRARTTNPRTEAAPPAGTSQSLPVQPSAGGEELSMAQRYLNGSGGSRNAAQAADWLWKAVAKQNTQATVLLSDLYLHGDGVSKNCDQARILLDAAARKGNKDATERLRHMQAFGCQ